MKKFLVLIGFLLIAAGLKAAGPGLDCYSVSVSTYAVTEVARTAAQIDGVANVRKILLTNSSTSTAQTVTFYELADATTTITVAFSLDMAAGDTEAILDFTVPSEFYPMNDMAIRKSSTSSTVRATIWYR